MEPKHSYQWISCDPLLFLLFLLLLSERMKLVLVFFDRIIWATVCAVSLKLFWSSTPELTNISKV